MSDTNSVVSLFLTPHLSIDLSPLEADLVTGKTSPPPDEQIPNLIARLKPYATKVLAAIGACHGRTQVVVISNAALFVLQSAGLIYRTSGRMEPSAQGKGYSLVPGRAGYCLIATGYLAGSLFGLTIMVEKETHFFPINDDVANAKVNADILTRTRAQFAAEGIQMGWRVERESPQTALEKLKAAQAQSEAAGEAAGVSQAALVTQVSTLRKGSDFDLPIVMPELVKEPVNINITVNASEAKGAVAKLSAMIKDAEQSGKRV